MSLSSINRKQEKAALPVPLNPQKGFGSGFRFHYEGTTHQSEWARRTYNSLVLPKPANDETGLTPFDRLAFATEISIRYHHRRHTHYDSAFRMMMMGIVLLTAFAFLGGVNARAVLGLSIIGLAAGSVLWNITGLSRLHDVLCSEYKHLLELIRMNSAPQENDLKTWRKVRTRIRMKEPPVFWAVANDCYYEVARDWQIQPKKRERLPLMLRPFMNWVRF